MTSTTHRRNIRLSVLLLTGLSTLPTLSNAFDIEAGDTKVSIYGYAKADLIFDQDADLGTTTFGLVNVDPDARSNVKSRFQAIQSRIGIKTVRETESGPLTSVVEGDFFGSGGGNFRLRHAYGSIAGFIVGQTWSNWMPIESFPSTLDFQGPTGITFARIPQVRYTWSDANFTYSGSIERDPGSDESPAVTAAAIYKQGDLFTKLAIAIRGLGESESGYGINLSGHLPVWAGGTFFGSIIFGEGIGSYMNFGGADVDQSGDAIETFGLTLGISHKINRLYSVAAAYGLRDNDADEADPVTPETINTLHLTFNYNPVKNLSFGAEYFYGRSDRFNGDDADASRIQLAGQVNF